ncbi:type VI secretion system tube protein Hcp [Jejudonia soesokkakensis]|uniref:Type VI secretion system tube protein Hcp n=1 Tax=Jejudonia soesokkakensis TaxID=1323432 RepID=A0ABW2MTU8_9FLAO
MKTKIITIALVAITCTSTQLTAQEASSKSVGYESEKNVRCVISPTDTGFSVVFETNVKNSNDIRATNASSKKGYDYYKAKSEFSVSSTDNSVTEVISPRDAASGLPTGKRQHKPLTIRSEIDKSTPSLTKPVSNTVNTTEGAMVRGTGGGAGKVSLQDITVTKSCGGKTTTIPVVDGECIIPTTDCPDGDCNLKITWTWNDGSTSTDSDWTRKTNNSVNFVCKIEEGVCTAMASNEKEVSREKTNKGRSKN